MAVFIFVLSSLNFNPQTHSLAELNATIQSKATYAQCPWNISITDWGDVHKAMTTTTNVTRLTLCYNVTSTYHWTLVFSFRFGFVERWAHDRAKEMAKNDCRTRFFVSLFIFVFFFFFPFFVKLKSIDQIVIDL